MNLHKENANTSPQAISSASLELSDMDLENVVGGYDDRGDHFKHWHYCHHHHHHRCHEHRHWHEHDHFGDLLPRL